MPKSKAYANPLPSLADQARYAQKCKELKAKIREVEEENVNTQHAILKSQKNIQRLRIERAILYEALAANATELSMLTGEAITPTLPVTEPGRCRAEAASARAGVSPRPSASKVAEPPIPYGSRLSSNPPGKELLEDASTSGDRMEED